MKIISLGQIILIRKCNNWNVGNYEVFFAFYDLCEEFLLAVRTASGCHIGSAIL